MSCHILLMDLSLEIETLDSIIWFHCLVTYRVKLIHNIRDILIVITNFDYLCK